MGVVGWMVGSADSFLASAAESQFGAVASNIGTITLLGVVVSCLVAAQARAQDGPDPAAGGALMPDPQGDGATRRVRSRRRR